MQTTTTVPMVNADIDAFKIARLSENDIIGDYSEECNGMLIA